MPQMSSCPLMDICLIMSLPHCCASRLHLFMYLYGRATKKKEWSVSTTKLFSTWRRESYWIKLWKNMENRKNVLCNRDTFNCSRAAVMSLKAAASTCLSLLLWTSPYDTAAASWAALSGPCSGETIRSHTQGALWHSSQLCLLGQTKDRINLCTNRAAYNIEHRRILKLLSSDGPALYKNTTQSQKSQNSLTRCCGKAQGNCELIVISVTLYVTASVTERQKDFRHWCLY